MAVDINKCPDKLDFNIPLMQWAKYNLKTLDLCIKKYGDDIPFLKQVCDNVLKALELANVDSLLLVEFLNARGYGVAFENISRNNELKK